MSQTNNRLQPRESQADKEAGLESEWIQKLRYSHRLGHGTVSQLACITSTSSTVTN